MILQCQPLVLVVQLLGHNYESDIQRAFYSGYLHRHGLKAQVVYLPIGIIGSVFITEIWQNDSGVLNMSGLSCRVLDANNSDESRQRNQ